MSGSAIGLEPETKTCNAILQAWYGGQQGGQAVVDVLSGDYNPAGRLPITFYRSDDDLPDFGDYNMNGQKGHTYRYFKGEPLFAFGEGMSYSTFEYGNARLRHSAFSKADGEMIQARYSLLVTLKNTSQRDGEEVVQVYLKRNNDEEGPARSLRGFKRVFVKAGQTVQVEVPIEDFSTYNPGLKDLHWVVLNLTEDK